jgi:dihydroorotase-like cyclic amidohydrolase
MDSGVMRHVLEYSRLVAAPVIVHCEDRTLVADGVVNEGPVSTKLGLPGNPALAEITHIQRDLLLAEATGAHLHVAHVSTAGGVETIRSARERGSTCAPAARAWWMARSTPLPPITRPTRCTKRIWTSPRRRPE